MKRIVSAVAAVIVCSAAMFVGCSSGERYTTDVGSLPQTSRTVVKSHFSDLRIAQIKIDDDEYEVQFANGTKIEFTNNGQLKDVVSAPGDSVPSAIIPAPVKEYVDSAYPGQHVIELEIGRRDNEVKLSSGIELKFSKDGQFIKID